jgi:predicted component of type VI protein secretion system
MPAQLVALNAGPGIVIDKPILLIGRDLECDIQIDSRKVSRRHCLLAQIGDYLVIRDLGSTNGVRINGVRVKEGRLNEDDELTIGSLRYRLSFDSRLKKNKQHQALPSGKPAPRPLAIRDEDLESCEEPVALPEPNRLAVPSKGQPTPKSKSHPGVHQAPAGDAAHAVRQPELQSSVIIPGEHGLPPVGDMLPRPEAPPAS